MKGTQSGLVPTLGFFTVVEHAELGLTGGYLVLNTVGRPLEFHCTAPVKTSRAQEILYGPTLKPFLIGEQIGLTLVEKSRFEPLFICTDLEPALTLRDATSVPVALLFAGEQGGQEAGRLTENVESRERRWDAPHASVRKPVGRVFQVGSHHLAVSARFADDEQAVVQAWQTQAHDFDLAEPFERIREAIAEAQRTR